MNIKRKNPTSLDTITPTRFHAFRVLFECFSKWNKHKFKRFYVKLRFYVDFIKTKMFKYFLLFLHIYFHVIELFQNELEFIIFHFFTTLRRSFMHKLWDENKMRNATEDVRYERKNEKTLIFLYVFSQKIKCKSAQLNSFPISSDISPHFSCEFWTVRMVNYLWSLKFDSCELNCVLVIENWIIHKKYDTKWNLILKRFFGKKGECHLQFL